jgi:ABC-2 type transport system permease protein
VLPVVARGFLGTIGSPGGRSVATLLPGVLALALVASGLVNLGLATAYERGYGVLKRLGGAPLGRAGLVSAKVVVVGAIAASQVLALVALAAVLGWRPEPDASIVAVAAATLVGIASFAALGLLLAGTLRPEGTLFVANALFLLALLVGGVVVPVADLPAPLESIAGLLPVGALAEAFRAALGNGTGYAGHLAIVAVWGAVALAVAFRTFRWE